MLPVMLAEKQLTFNQLPGLPIMQGTSAEAYCFPLWPFFISSRLRPMLLGFPAVATGASYSAPWRYLPARGRHVGTLSAGVSERGNDDFDQ